MPQLIVSMYSILEYKMAHKYRRYVRYTAPGRVAYCLLIAKFYL